MPADREKWQMVIESLQKIQLDFGLTQFTTETDKSNPGIVTTHIELSDYRKGQALLESPVFFDLLPNKKMSRRCEILLMK